MSKESGSALEAIKSYIQTEIDGHQFYQKAAERTEDTRGRKMFLSLATDEMEHIRRLKGEYNSLMKTGRWLTEDELSQQRREGKTSSFPIFPSDDEQAAASIPEGTDDLQALKIAIDMEKASYEQYAREANAASDPAAKSLFQILMQEEKQHLKIVESSYEYLADTGSWFQSMEKPIFEG